MTLTFRLPVLSAARKKVRLPALTLPAEARLVTLTPADDALAAPLLDALVTTPPAELRPPYTFLPLAGERALPAGLTVAALLALASRPGGAVDHERLAAGIARYAPTLPAHGDEPAALAPAPIRALVTTLLALNRRGEAPALFVSGPLGADLPQALRRDLIPLLGEAVAAGHRFVIVEPSLRAARAVTAIGGYALVQEGPAAPFAPYLPPAAPAIAAPPSNPDPSEQAPPSNARPEDASAPSDVDPSPPSAREP